MHFALRPSRHLVGRPFFVVCGILVRLEQARVGCSVCVSPSPEASKERPVVLCRSAGRPLSCCVLLLCQVTLVGIGRACLYCFISRSLCISFLWCSRKEAVKGCSSICHYLRACPLLLGRSAGVHPPIQVYVGVCCKLPRFWVEPC